jgi:hypothetical protein
MNYINFVNNNITKSPVVLQGQIFLNNLNGGNTMSKRYNVTLSIPIDFDMSDVMQNFEETLEIKADNYDEAVEQAKQEFADNYDADYIYDLIFDDIKMNGLVYLDGDYEPDFDDEDYYDAEEIKEKKQQ